MGATKIMIIRHAEKPGNYNGTAYDGVNLTGNIAGADGRKHLITIGWQRAGALVTLFAPPWGPKPGLATPAHLFASNPESDSANADDSGPSQRPHETLAAVAARFGLTIDTHYKKAHYDKMVAAALAQDGVVLIAWQHEDIPLLTKTGQPGISQSILTQTHTPAGKFAIPQTWPRGRYDLIFVFDRPDGNGPIKGFSLIGQMLLAGDAPSPP